MILGMLLSLSIIHSVNDTEYVNISVMFHGTAVQLQSQTRCSITPGYSCLCGD